MKVDCCSSRCLALLLLALLEAVTLVFPQQQRCEDLTNTCRTEAMENSVNKVATDMEFGELMCSISAPMLSGDELEWYFTRTTIGNAIRINIDGSKYHQIAHILTVNNVSLNDEGYYFCRLRRNDGQTVTMPQEGTCLRVLAPAMFQTCSGDNVPQRGCSGTELLTATIGESVDFNIVLVHGGRNESCNNQFIQMISLFKIDGPSSRITLTDCPNSDCSHNVSLMERLKISRTPNEFNIIVTLNNLTEADSGSYSAVADVRSPPNSMRMCMYKNFTLTVSKKPISGQETTIIPTSARTKPISDQEIIIILTLVLLFIIVAIIIILSVCICSICYYHYRKKTHLGQRLRRVSTGGPASNIYDVPTEIHDAQLIPDDREVTIAHPNHETKMLMQENSAYGTNIGIAPEIANVAYEHTSRSDSGEKEIGHAVNEYGLESKTDDSTSTNMYSEISPRPTTCQGPQ